MESINISHPEMATVTIDCFDELIGGPRCFAILVLVLQLFHTLLRFQRLLPSRNRDMDKDLVQGKRPGSTR
jgi:hypothetical protein